MFDAISVARYRFWAIATFTVLVALTLLFPFLIYVIVQGAVGGQCDVGICGVLAVVAGFFLKGAIVFGSLAVFLVFLYKRLRDSFSVYWLFFAIMLAWGSYRFLFAAGNFWGANFSAGIISFNFPFILLALLLLAVLFALDIENAPNYRGALTSVRGPFGLPSGKLYQWSAIAIAGGYILSTVFLWAIWSLSGFGSATTIALMGPGAILSALVLLPVFNVIAGILLIIGLYLKPKQDSGAQHPTSLFSQPRNQPIVRNVFGKAQPQFGRRQR